LAPDAEITMEANPGTVEYDNLDGYRGAGVNRLSIGAQSFDANLLQRLGRIHGPEEITKAYADATTAGFDNINIDIMFALPGQSAAMAMQDVAAALALEPQHISYYQLTLEPNTVFHARPPPGLPDDELCWSIQLAGQAALRAAGYGQYEVSAFAAQQRECRHNLNYWQFGDYLAVGAGAHGKLSDAGGRVRRYEKPAHPQTYIEQGERGQFADNERILADDDVAFEYMLNILRLLQGFAEHDFCLRTGLTFDTIAGKLALAQTQGLLDVSGCGNWRPTDLGLRFLNDLQALFLPPATPEAEQIGQELSSSAAPFP